MSRPRIAIFGTGAMGCLLAARLQAAAVGEVVVAGTWPQGLTRLRTQGVAFEDGSGAPPRILPVVATTYDALGGLAPFDVVFVAIKSFQTATAAPVVAKIVADEGLVVSLQNGLGNREQLAAAAGEGVVVMGASAAAATLAAPGHVRFGGDGGTWLAPPSGVALEDPRLDAIVRLLRRAGLRVDLCPDADAMLWSKVAVNCAINPLTVLADRPNGALLETAGRRALLAAVAEEVARVAAAKGVVLDEEPAARALAVAEATADNLSSMLQDVRRGRPTEIDALCGAVAGHGADLDVPTPLNRALRDAVTAIEAGERAPRHLDALVEQVAA